MGLFHIGIVTAKVEILNYPNVTKLLNFIIVGYRACNDDFDGIIFSLKFQNSQKLNKESVFLVKL